jgi:hypothetical protein
MAEASGMYCVVSAPEAQIFQPHLQDELLENPELIFKRRNVKIYVERSSGRIEFTLGVPKPFGRRQSSDKQEDLPNIIPWLTGGEDGMRCQETEIYGCVSMGIEDDIAGTIQQIVHESMLSGAVPEIPANLKAQMEAATAASEIKSRERVMRAARRCYRQLQDQYRINLEAGGQKYQPSKSELLCQYVLRREIQAEKMKQDKINAHMNDTMSLDTMSTDLALTEKATTPRKRRTKAEMAAAAQAEVDSGVQSQGV